MKRASIEHEIIVVNDHSTDATQSKLRDLVHVIPSLKYADNERASGFGLAVRTGFDFCSGDAVAVYMADGSDTPADLIKFFRTMEDRKVECVFGSRFVSGARVVDYPLVKLILNRITNLSIQILFGIPYNDVTNAFKLYRRHVLEGLKPLLSPHYNLTVELPLKAIVRGYSYCVVSNDWIQRKTGKSKLKIQEMGSRYLFIILYCFIEKLLSKGDYRRGNNLVDDRRLVQQKGGF